MEGVPYKAAIVKANRYVIINHVDYLIAYAWQPGSNARKLVEYTQKKGKPAVVLEVGKIHL